MPLAREDGASRHEEEHRAVDAARAVLRPDVRRRGRAGQRGLHHGLVEGHVARRRSSAFPLVFFAIWWAWMNFTWFASAYDTDDVPYRIAVFVQMTGVLVLAAGVPRAFEDQTSAS